MKHYFCKIEETSGEYSFTTSFLMREETKDLADKVLEAIVLNWRGEGEWWDAKEKNMAEFDCGCIIAKAITMDEIKKEEYYVINKYLTTVTEDIL